MRPTALGVKAALFYLLLVAAFFAASYSNLFFLLLLFLTILGVLDLLWNRRNLVGVAATVDEPAPAPAGSGVLVVARIDADGRPRHAVTVELDAEGLAEPVRLGAARVAGETHLRARTSDLPRGLYAVTSARLVSTWPLGLLRSTRPLPAPGPLVLYPRPADLAKETDARGGHDGLAGAAGFRQPSGLREFRPGDELRRVHWKASARRAGPVVTEWEGGAGRGREVVLDRRAGSDELERALSLLSALVVVCRDEKEALTLHTQGLSATFGGEHRPWRDLLTFLAGADRLPAGAAPPPPASPGVTRLPGGAA